MQAVIDKARVLIEALPYISQFRGKAFVVKIGGAALEDLALRQRFVEDIILLSWVGIRVVVVHGGGKQISAMLDRLGIEPRFVDGLRVTDQATLEVVEMVLGGSLNKELVRLVNRGGGRAVGLCGKDGRLAVARRRGGSPDLGLVGDITHIDRTVLDHLFPEFIPVIAPLAVTSQGETLNVNADTFAAHLAMAVDAEKLILLTDVSGVNDEGGALIPTLTAHDAQTGIESSVIRGGMIPKVENALAALRGGVQKVHIVDGRLEHAVLLEIFTKSGVGTQVVTASQQAEELS